MKKKIAVVLILAMLLTCAAISSSVFGEGTTDTATSASITEEGTASKAADKAPATKAPATNATVAVTDPSGIYVVVSGDMMWKIAAKFNLSLDALIALNPQIKNPSLIFQGDKIIVKAAAPATTAAAPAKKYFHGFGESANYRVRGAQKDNLNITTASAIFDQDGKIVSLTWDVMEITYALFPGWVDPDADQATKDAFVASIDDKWITKREEGYEYDMTHLISKGAADNLTKKEWFEQLDYFESYFKGMTVAKVEAWFKKYADANGRPYKMAYPDKLTDADKTATANFTDDEKAMLVDVTTSATMSLEDPHSHFITALKEAYAARIEIK
jgi:LysM repeat protein